MATNDPPQGQGNPAGKKLPKFDPKTRVHLGYWLMAIVAVFWLQSIWSTSQDVQTVPYSQFQTELQQGKFSTIVVGHQTITGTLKSPDAGGKKIMVAVRVDPQLADQLQRQGVTYSQAYDNTWLSNILSWALPALVFFGVWYFMVRKFAEKQGGMGMGGFMSIGKSRAKVYMENRTGVTFADVAGVDEAKAELEEIVDFLKNPVDHSRLGARAPKGVLLVGPPGVGKTLLARAVAGEAGVPFYSISGSEFVEMFVGVGAARVRDLFEQARKQAPAIIFIDELDAMGRARGSNPFGGGGHDEKEQTLNQLLVELDGFDASTGLIILAATNRPEILDAALLRAGRFDRQVLVDRPDKTGRVQVLQVHVRKVHLDPSVDLEQVAALTPGFSGADLANLVNEAALVATRHNARTVTTEHFTLAVERIVAGLEKKNRLLNPKEREIVAHHEMGHAIVSMSLPGTDVVHKVSIIPRGVGALGYTIQRPTEDRYLMTRQELENKMAVLMGGRAAEHIVYGHWSTGAADDLAKVADIARSMVTRYAMVDKLGSMALDNAPQTMLGGPVMPQQREYSEQTAREVDCAVRELVNTAFSRAEAILQSRRAVLDEGARQLLDKETLSGAELIALTQLAMPAESALAGVKAETKPAAANASSPLDRPG
ncbi:MAG: ATP-dependent zinc metalloprotease FtsH [Betaproteobacteria bacterium]|nr:ATP-dependent zinc metalloprotease FtsH [Betaproteobacteria bacterium]MDE2124453.1 ATP-dependent zinc metalloprotease FtsH [Betaproteobacteria bacterium]MDE2185759.1 ATP-dependent zinc metalloprotease FtsH [Betaproteobacteria bacterium]MDE2324830.1 ATP-dependent zinc metalloprotease FtsH [Betaproteobacteria bacterium]